MSAYVPKGQESAINYESKMVSKQRINEVPTQMKQAPNRTGNHSMKPANAFSGRQNTKGVTDAPPNQKLSISQPKGSQGAPKASGNPLPRSMGSVSVNRPKDDYKQSDAYIKANHIKFGG